MQRGCNVGNEVDFRPVHVSRANDQLCQVSSNPISKFNLSRNSFGYLSLGDFTSIQTNACNPNSNQKLARKPDYVTYSSIKEDLLLWISQTDSRMSRSLQDFKESLKCAFKKNVIFSKANVMVRIDNQAVVNIINKQATSEQLIQILVELLELMEIHQCRIKAIYVPGWNDLEADNLTRFKDTCDLKYDLIIFNNLCNVKKIFSQILEENNSGTDVLLQNFCSFNLIYTFSPQILIPSTIIKLLETPNACHLILPDWVGATQIPLMMQLKILKQIILGSFTQVTIQGYSLKMKTQQILNKVDAVKGSLTYASLEETTWNINRTILASQFKFAISNNLDYQGLRIK
ncbi:MAG: hypothetical protein EZS28_021734 [Streblomastix strix]|uniref:Uncharacterized protein n=1 Tax=Streblomastix strix TaxID=222440 RepID=A0A5J4VJU6_9EUKA|nr:MAG: hypothetical protein EZS28_021734 [Streblomastix strix]